MLYLLELFDSGYGIKAIELNLICQFNDRDNFWAIFGGVNRYKFIKVLPLVGHSYQRQILMRRETNSIEYRVTDLTDVVSESFTFEIASAADRATTSFQGSNHFTGLEWWNKAGNFPFPIRYKVEMSNLKYGQPIDKNREAHDTYENLTYSPFNALAPHLDGYTAKYPAIFTDVGLKDGCICYTLTSGSCSTGLGFVAY
jgi:hypothetical protein